MNDTSDHTRLSSCPAWCERHDFAPANFPGDDTTIGHHSRRWLIDTTDHRPAEVFAIADEYGDQLDIATVTVIYAEGMTAAQTRRLAAALLEAADVLDGGAA